MATANSHGQHGPDRPAVAAAQDSDELLRLLQDPVGDPRLDEIPDSIRNPISDIANALLAQDLEPTPARVAAVARQLGLPPLDQELLAGLLMELWWIRLNDLAPGDLQALQAHLEAVPIRTHPCCYFVIGLINGLAAGRQLGLSAGHATGNGR